jgi:glycosyltransferase involved in cell wall biosynthesis
MNVLFVNRFSFSYLGGVELHIRNLGRQLLARGHQVTLVCGADAGGCGELQVNGIRVVRVRGMWGLWRFLRREARGFDIVHAHMSRKPFSALGLVLARLQGRKTVFTPHCFYPPSGWIGAFAKRAYDATLTAATLRAADRVLSLTPQDRRDALQRGSTLEQSRIVPNSIDMDRFRLPPALGFRAQHGIERAYLLHVGRFQEQKCVPFLVAQQALLSELDLVLIGQDDGALGSVRQLIERLGLAPRVHIFQSLGFRELHSAYCEAALLVMASRSEGLPTVILEAMACGLPVVAPGVGGIPYILQHGVTGFVYGWGDGEAYRSCVVQALRCRTAMVQAAQAAVRERFSWERNAEEILKIYSELLPPDGRRPPAGAA